MYKSNPIFSTKVIAEIAAFVSLSTALSYIKLFSLPQGGSVTAGSMVPILWLALRRGAKIGLFAAVVYGVVQLVVEPFIFHPAQVVLDYPLAFGMLGLAGFFQDHPFVGANLGIIGRFLAHLFQEYYSSLVMHQKECTLWFILQYTTEATFYQRL